jgi:hypothetical protein
MRMFASIHFLPPSTSCLHPLPASVHFLPSSTCFSTYRRLCSVQSLVKSASLSSATHESFAPLKYRSPCYSPYQTQSSVGSSAGSPISSCASSLGASLPSRRRPNVITLRAYTLPGRYCSPVGSTSSTIPFGGNMDFFSLRGPPAYYASIGLGPWGGTPSKSTSPNVNEPNRNLMIIGRALKHSIDCLECFFTVIIPLPALPLSAKVNIALYAAYIYLTSELHIRSLRTKHQLAPRGLPFIFIINTFPAGVLPFTHYMPSRQ